MLTTASTSPSSQLAPDPPVEPFLTPLRRRRVPPAAAGLFVLLVDAAIVLGCLALSGSLHVEGLALLVVLPVVFALSGAYRLRVSLSALDQLPGLVARVAVALVLVAPLRFEGGPGRPLLRALFVIAALGVGRAVAYAVVRLARRAGLVAERTLVLGDGEVADEVASVLARHPEFGLAPVGFLRRAPEGIGDVLDRHRPDRLIVAFGPTPEADLVALLRTAAEHDMIVHVIPRFFDVGVAPTGPDVDDLWGIPLWRVHPAAFRRRDWRLKRIFDVAVAGTALLVASPFLVPVALAVKVTSPGPLFFRQRRIGQHGRQFDVLKFRTLRSADEAAEVVDLRSDDLGVQSRRQRDVERRMTRVGSVLRTTGLDEVPQLWNVLRGDMSLVGPRPEECGYAATFAASVRGYCDRHRLPVGLTGWAQVHGLRGETSIAERARFDNYYIEHWSLWRDVLILLRTATAVLRQLRPTPPPAE